jgi:hypothetical protein
MIKPARGGHDCRNDRYSAQVVTIAGMTALDFYKWSTTPE